MTQSEHQSPRGEGGSFGAILVKLFAFLIAYPAGFVITGLPLFAAAISKDWSNLPDEIVNNFQDAPIVAMGVSLAFLPGLLTFFYFAYRKLTSNWVSTPGAFLAGALFGMICAGAFVILGLQEINTPEGSPSKLPDFAAVFVIISLAALAGTMLTYLVLRLLGIFSDQRD